MDDNQKAIQNIKQALRQLATNGVPVGNMIEAMKEIEEKYAESEDEKIIYDAIKEVCNVEDARAFAQHNETVFNVAKRVLEKQGEQKQVEVKPFNKVFSQEQIDEIDKRIETEIKLYNAKLMDAQMRAKDFPMTD